LPFLFSAALFTTWLFPYRLVGVWRPDFVLLASMHGALPERSDIGRRLGLGNGWRGWLFTVFVLLAPVIFLLHRPFVLKVIAPFMKDLGAL